MDIAIITITSSACTPAHQFPSRVLIYVITFAVLFIANFAFAFFFSRCAEIFSLATNLFMS